MAPSKNISFPSLLEPVNVTLFGKRIFANASISKILRWNHFQLPKWTPTPMILIRDRQKTDTERDAM
jgi:hypothetical protein